MEDETISVTPHDTETPMSPWHTTAPLPDTLAKIIQHISDNLHLELDHHNLAGRYDMDAIQLETMFQSHLSQTPAEFQKKVRLNKAQYLLEQTLLSLETVAYKSGFGDISSLQDAFLQNLNMFPSRYK